MNQNDLEQFLAADGFVPFVITTFSGFAIPISDPRKTLVASNLIVIKDEKTGMLYHIALRAIEHISHLGEIG